MVRFVLLAWVTLSVPCSLVLGLVCPGLGVQPVPSPNARRRAHIAPITSRSA